MSVPMPDDAILRDKARAAVLDRKLARRNPDRLWDGPGDGTPCPVCGLPVTKDEKELVIEFTRDSPGDTFHIHIRCFAAWVTERERTYWA